MPACARREIVREGEPGIFQELIETVREFPRCFRRLAGSVGQFAARAGQVGRRWLHGVRHAARVFR